MRYGINRVSISPGHLNQIKVTCNYIVSWMIRGKLNARQSKLNHQPTNNERRKQKRDVMRGVFVKWFLPMIRTSAYCEAAMACLWNCNFWSRCHPAYDCQRFVSNAQNWPSAAIQKHKNIEKKKKERPTLEVSTRMASECPVQDTITGYKCIWQTSKSAYIPYCR